MESQIQGLKDNPLPPTLGEAFTATAAIPDPTIVPTPTPAPEKTAEQIAAEKVEADKVATEKLAAETKAKEEATKKAEEEAQATADKRYAELKAKPEATLTEAEKKELTELEPEDEGTVADDEFWNSVDKLHGIDPKDLNIDYGSTDKSSAEGIVIRERALMEYGAKQLNEYYRQADPRSYAYFLHRQAGGDDETFFNTPSITLPDYETFKNNVDLQKQFYTKDLQRKGLSESHIKMIVDQTIKDGKLFEESDKSFQAQKASEDKVLADAEKLSTEQKASEAKEIASMSSVIDDIVNNSKTEKIVIPDTKKVEFNKAVKDSLFFDGKQFFIVKPFTKETAAELIQAEYFAYVKGNLKELVERQANTITANRLKVRAKKTEKAPTAGGNNGSTNKNVVPFAEL